MIYPILKMGDPRLLKVSDPIQDFDTPALHQLIADMFETMQHANGAGLAAPQIGINLQLVIFGFKKNLRYPDAPNVPETVLINPTLTPLSTDTDEAWEGCLSVPGMRGLVPRWSRLRYEGFDQFGNKIDREVDGFHARVVQHETDHLHGILYPMRIKDLTKFGYTEVLFPELDPSDDD
ncbi:peptide deformylase [Undibacterium macrobrachii]|uniref:Peptide deformylase n=1 Tax=Undibacterium macrobrachii TaxID=1119058 RepID=A0ABQ2X4F2_9BURK|nr:peptide deformylase [Undibacterium macrobrachii]GGW99251.1 peptide deformylase [Undibacterium macrobrachii]